MSSSNSLLSQCVEMTHQLIRNKQMATINIRIGRNFYFEFSNQENEAFSQEKKLFPSEKEILKEDWNLNKRNSLMTKLK
jgi:hypothetical protein